MTDGITINAATALAIIGGAGGVIAFLFKMLISSKDAHLAARDREFTLLMAQKEKALADLDSLNKSYKEVAAEALASATATANFYLQKEGKPPVLLVAPVISESHSPSTLAQREAALLATMRASMAAVKVAVNQPPRSEPDKAVESVDRVNVVKLVEAVKPQP